MNAVRVFALLSMLMMVVLAAPVAAHAQDQAGGTHADGQAPATNPQATGGVEYGAETAAPPRVYVPGTVAVVMDDVFAAAPADAPVQVQEAVFGANQIVGKP